LESRISIHNNNWISVDAETVRTAKVCAEAIFGNAIAAVASAFPPTAMFTLPMLCAMILPNVARTGISFGFAPAYLAKVFRPMRRLVCLPLFGPALLRALLVTALFRPPFRPIPLMTLRAFRRTPVIFLMLVAPFFL
jgi:hypothetical protein